MFHNSIVHNVLYKKNKLIWTTFLKKYTYKTKHKINRIVNCWEILLLVRIMNQYVRKNELIYLKMRVINRVNMLKVRLIRHLNL